MSQGHRPYIAVALVLALGAVAGWIQIFVVVESASHTPLPQETSDSPAASSVLDGVFTASQASRGETKFQQECMFCHTPDEHAGPRFAVTWSGMTVGDLFDLISNTMPEADPGSLRPEEYVDILAFFLSESGYPEGQQELPSDLDALRKVRIEALPQ